MTYLTLLTALPSVEWSPKVAIVMASYNLLAIILGKLFIKYPNEGPAAPGAAFFGGFSLPAVIACWCFGHVMAVGGILGMSTLGIL
ncbi:MAG: photosystem I reaction center subunit PsaK [Cyanothece sp. SIO1E1]|nr:photosystem I reaction center subunit PsaK [Cyanothece sp. SIO1E1]